MTTSHTVLNSRRAEISFDSKMELDLFVDADYTGSNYIGLAKGAPEALAVAVRLIYAVWLYEPELVRQCLRDLSIDVISTYNKIEGDRYVAS